VAHIAFFRPWIRSTALRQTMYSSSHHV